MTGRWNSQFRTAAVAHSVSEALNTSSSTVIENERRLTQVQAEKVAAHSVVQFGAMENKLPLHLWRHLGRSA